MKISPILTKLTALTASPLLTKIAIAVGALLFILAIYFLVRSSPEKYYAKAARRHKWGEASYLRGDHEAAESYYMKAEELRKRARELE